MNWAINKEFLDEFLATEYLHEPETQCNILLQGISDERDIIWQHRSLFGSDSNCHEEGYEEL